MVMRNLLENRCLVKNMDGQPVGRQSIGGGVNPRECTDVRLAPKGRHRIGGVRKSPWGVNPERHNNPVTPLGFHYSTGYKRGLTPPPML